MTRFPECSGAEIIYYSKAVGIVVLLPVVLVSGEMTAALEYARTYPQLLWMSVLFSITGVLGEIFVMVMVKQFGALLTVTVTSCRKMFTILFSFLLFPKVGLANLFFVTLNFATFPRTSDVEATLRQSYHRSSPRIRGHLSLHLCQEQEGM